MKTSVFRSIGFAGALAILISAAAFAKEATPAGSYLRYRADTVAELQSQIASDAVAQARYSAFFGVPASELSKKIGDGLQLISLKTPLLVDVWYVSGKSVSHKTKLLPEGSQVFANAEGVPVLAWSCGNPLKLKQKFVSEPLPPKEKPGIVTEVKPGLEVVSTAVLAAPPALMAETTPLLTATVPTLTAPALSAAAQPAIAGIMPAVASSGGKLYNLGWLAGLAALSSHRSNSVPVVPEPSTLLAIFTGVGSATAFAWRTRRRK